MTIPANPPGGEVRTPAEKLDDLFYYGQFCLSEGRLRDAVLWVAEQIQAKDRALTAISSDERIPLWIQAIARDAILRATANKGIS